jgi:hypothetical protein
MHWGSSSSFIISGAVAAFLLVKEAMLVAIFVLEDEQDVD